MTVEGQQFLTLAELTEAADVSIRTVRYYIAEGLLPPAEGAGPASVYTQGHLLRLRLIGRLKAAYLPLKEIRRRLAGLSDAEVAVMLADMDATETPTASPVDAAMAPARDYLSLLEQRARYRSEPLPLPAPARAPASVPDVAPARPPRRQPEAPPPDAMRFPPFEESELPGTGDLPPPHHAPAGEVGTLWRRIPLGNEAELVISEHAYARQRERIDWLIRWARKVFS
ncbi:MAG: MerR family transcriptional regulator [Thermomicrobiales bacterium]